MAASPLSPFPQRVSGKPPAGELARNAETPPPVWRVGRLFYVGYAVEGISRDTLIRLIDHPELPLKIHTRDVIKAGRTALLVRGEFPIGDRMVSVAYKQVQRRSGWKVLSAWLFGNRTYRTWKMALTLERLGIPTARPLMVVIPRWHQPQRPSYLACEWLNPAYNLTTYSEWLNEIPHYEARQRLQSAAEALGELIGRMHRSQVSHRDLKAGNLLLINKPTSVEAFLIDLDGARRLFWLPRFRRLRDLSRLALAVDTHETLTRAARLRFLFSYLRAFGEPAGQWKTYWRKLALLTLQRRRTKHKPGSCRS